MVVNCLHNTTIHTEAAVVHQPDIGEVEDEGPRFGFAILLAVLLSLPLWGAIIWLTRLAWRHLA